MGQTSDQLANGIPQLIDKDNYVLGVSLPVEFLWVSVRSRLTPDL